ncbi:hypothetical protein B4096_0508 [Heyndrickxia coagulans]|nr:hypothetical protein B4096_0508 [Heyndrickxia coagulans]
MWLVLFAKFPLQISCKCAKCFSFLPQIPFTAKISFSLQDFANDTKL